MDMSDTELILKRRVIHRSVRDEDTTKTKYSSTAPLKEGLYLHKKVFLGYTDISAAGSRALLSLSLKKEYCDLDIPELKSCEVICRPNSSDIDISLIPLQIMHCKYEEFSLIVLNALIPSRHCHLVADKIIQLCADCNVEKLVILTTLNLDILEKTPAPLYENTFNTRALTTKPRLPENTKVNDAFLNTLIQMIQLEHIPCHILVAPGHRAYYSVPSLDDSSLQAIREFHQFITGWTRLKFDEGICQSLEYGRLEKMYRSRTSMYS